MIEPAGIPRSIPVADLMKVRYTAERLSLPLREPYFVRFEHVTGLPGAGDGGGYSVFKLRILDALIHRLTALRGAGGGGPMPDGENPDEAITGLGRLLHQELAKAGATPFGVAVGAGAAENGGIVDILV